MKGIHQHARSNLLLICAYRVDIPDAKMMKTAQDQWTGQIQPVAPFMLPLRVKSHHVSDNGKQLQDTAQSYKGVCDDHDAGKGENEEAIRGRRATVTDSEA